MKVLVISPRHDLLTDVITDGGDRVFTRTERDPFLWIAPPENLPEADFVVSFGYTKIFPKEIINKYNGNIINIHISMLPYNRGASPNFWSWFDGTPKGVSIHKVDEGVDTGPLLTFAEMAFFGPKGTLHSTYVDLTIAAAGLFRREWQKTIRPLKQGLLSPYARSSGSYHKDGADKPFLSLLSAEYHSPVSEIELMGKMYRGESCRSRLK